MGKVQAGALIMILALLSFGASAAPMMWSSKVEYSAESVAETPEGLIKGKVYHVHNMERREMDIKGEKSVLIIRQDKKVMWTLMPEEHAYLQSKFDSAASRGDFAGYKIDQTAVGREKIDGVMTTKTKVNAKNDAGDTFNGYWWITKDGIPMKVDVMSVENGHKMPVKMQLTNLRIGKQDPKLFEIPAGYSQMGMGMPNLNELMGGHHGKGDDEDSGDHNQGKNASQDKGGNNDKKDQGGGFGFKDIFKKMIQ